MKQLINIVGLGPELFYISFQHVIALCSFSSISLTPYQEFKLFEDQGLLRPSQDSYTGLENSTVVEVHAELPLEQSILLAVVAVWLLST